MSYVGPTRSCHESVQSVAVHEPKKRKTLVRLASRRRWKRPIPPAIMSLRAGCLAGMPLCFGVFIWTAAVSAVPVDFRYLAADPSLRGELTNAAPQMGQATYFGKMLELDQSWEQPFDLGYVGSVVTDPASGQWRMYYELVREVQSKERVTAVGFSDDGLTWTKPELDITGDRYTTDSRNNIINRPGAMWMRGPNVFVEPEAALPERYKYSWRINDTMYSDVSADGLNFQSAGIVQNGGSMDSLNTSFWDPVTQQYRAYIRWWFDEEGNTPRRRGVSLKRSDNWEGSWPGPRELILDPQDVFGPGEHEPDIYTGGVSPYHGQYVGLPSLYFHPGQRNASGAIYPTFMYSRDGVDWQFEDYNQPLLDLSAHGQTVADFGMAFAANSLVEREDSLWLYYSYTRERHHVTNRSPSEVHLAQLRKDGFVAIESEPGEIGEWVTPGIQLPDNALHLRVNAEVSGWFRVHLLDAATGEALAGYAGEDALLIGPGDYLGARASWNDVTDLSALANQQVALMFEMQDASIYSFRFDTGTNVFMATDDVAMAGPGDGTFGNAFQSGNFLKDEYQVDAAGAATGSNALAGGGDAKWRASAVQFDLTAVDAGSILSANLNMDLQDNRAGAAETQGPATVRIRMLADSEDGWVDDTVEDAPFTPLVSLSDGSVEVEVDADGLYSWDVTDMLTGANGLALNPIVGFIVDTTTPVFDKVIFQDLENSRDFGTMILGPYLEVTLVAPPATEFSWKADVSGDWRSGTNWSSSIGVTPNSAEHTAIFGDAIGSAQTVFTNAAVTVNSIQFDNPNSYVVAGFGSVNLAADNLGNPARISVNQGEHQFQAIVNLQADTTVDVSHGSTLIFNNALDLMGNTLTKSGNGEMAVRNDLNTGGGTIDVQQGMVSGNGTISGDVNNEGGSISPGNSSGMMVIEGNLTQGEYGSLLIELSGTTAGSQYDVLQVDGELSADGTLEVSLLDGFQPGLGDTFNILDFGSLSGEFGQVILPDLAGTLVWDDSAILTNGSISVVPEPATLMLLGVGLLGLVVQHGSVLRVRNP